MKDGWSCDPEYCPRYNSAVPYEARVDRVLAWMDLPEEQQPQFMTLYFEDPDHWGHQVAPGPAQPFLLFFFPSRFSFSSFRLFRLSCCCFQDYQARFRACFVLSYRFFISLAFVTSLSAVLGSPAAWAAR